MFRTAVTSTDIVPGKVRRAAVIVAATAAVASATTASAASQPAVWNGGANGHWNTASKWSGGVVPNNTAEHQFDVTIDGNAAVTSDLTGMPVTVNTLTVTPGDALRLVDTLPDAALTAINGFHVDGRIDVSYSRLKVGDNGTFTGSGIINSFGGPSWLTATGGSLTIGAGLTLKSIGDWFSPHIHVGESSYPLINNGTIWAADPFTGATIAGSTFTNNGTLRVGDRATLAIDTNLQQLSDLGHVVADGSGIVHVLGTIDNTGRTLHVDGSLPLRFGGTIKGGTITASSGQRFLTKGAPRFDGVTLNAPATVEGTLTFAAGQGLSGTAEVLLSGTSSLHSGGGTFTVGPNITVRGHQGTVGSPGAQLINQGRLISEQSGGKLTVTGNNWINQGTIEVKPGATLAVDGTVRTSDLGTIVNDGGNLSVVGTLDNRGQTLAVGTPHTWTLDGGRIVGGTITTAPGKNLLISRFTTGTLDGVTLDNATVEITPTGGPTILHIPNGIHGNGTILSLASTWQRIRTDANYSGKIEVDEGITIRAAAVDIAGSTVEIHGTMESVGGLFGSTVRISGDRDSSILMDGTLRANHRGRFQTGSLSLGDGGRFIAELDRFQPGMLEVLGDLDLSGEDFLDLVPPLQTGRLSYVVATYSGTLTGLFDHVTPGYEVDYSSNQITVTVVPEPSSLLMVGIGLAPLLGFRRRRLAHAHRQPPHR